MRIIIGIVMCAMGSFSALASDDTELFGRLLELANAEDSEAQYHVGMMFNNGIGVDRDPEEAFDWFLKSSVGGDALGAYKVGCYYAGQFGVMTIDLGKALDYKLVAAEAGYALAQSDVAISYAALGNSEEALRWWNEAAHQGYSGALQALSFLYYKGEYVPQDMALAYAYLELLFQAAGVEKNDATTAGIEQISAGLSAEEFNRAREFISDWKILPTLLTLKAGEGIQAALRHVEHAQ